MKEVAFKPPYLVSNRNRYSIVIDASNKEVGRFKDETVAEGFCKFLNEKEASRILDATELWEFQNPEIRKMVLGINTYKLTPIQKIKNIMNNLVSNKNK